MQRAAQAKSDRSSAEVASSAPSEPSSIQRYLHCQRVRNDVIAAEKRRLDIQPRWMIAAARKSPSDESYAKIKSEYDQLMADYDKLIPPNMRQGMPLFPNSVTKFQDCNPDDFFGP